MGQKTSEVNLQSECGGMSAVFSIHFNKTLRKTIKTCYGTVTNWR